LLIFLVPFTEKFLHDHHDAFSTHFIENGNSHVSEVCPVCNYELCASAPDQQQLPEQLLLLLDQFQLTNIQVSELTVVRYSFLLRAPPQS
jgi:hypothetical protein